MKNKIIIVLFLIFICMPITSFGTIIDIAEFNVSNYANQGGLSLFGDAQNTGYFTVGIGDSDYFTLFQVYYSDLNRTLSYWNGPPILPGQDTGDYFIRTITGYPFTVEEAHAFTTLIPMVYGYDNGSIRYHQITNNPQLGDYVINGIYLAIDAALLDGSPDITTRLYADVEASPVPEPSTILLLGIGCVGMLCFRLKTSHVQKYLQTSR